MAQNDIYNSKQRYETIKEKLRSGKYLKPYKNQIYYIKNKKNTKYYEILFKEFEYRDLSYIRRVNLLKNLNKICSQTSKDLKDLTREEVKNIISHFNNTTHKSIETRLEFVNYGKAIWKIILPEKDHKGRPDDSIVPYPWRVKVNNDPSLKKDRKDKLTEEEINKIQRSLHRDPRMQLYFSMIYECLARPQELSYINLEDVKLYDNYARVRIAGHGKEGTKWLQVINGYYYLSRWLNQHPLKQSKNKEVPLFITLGNRNKHKRLSPKHANNILHIKLKELGINKPVSNYSFKRNGVTIRYLAGEQGQLIQKVAGWKSTAQLQTYDLSSQDEFLDKELIEKGIIKPADKSKKKLVTYKQCAFCNSINPKSNRNCYNCKRPLDREEILKKEEEREQEITDLKKEMSRMNKILLALAKKEKIDNL